MRYLVSFIFTSLLAVSSVARAETAGVAGSHSVAPEPHLGSGVVAASDVAVGDTAPPTAPVDGGATTRRWYGWQSLVADGVLAAVMTAGLSSSTTTGDSGQVVAYGAAGAYLATGPITHLAHGSPGRALGSFALRAATPASLGLLGSQLSCGRMDELCTLGGVGIGMLVAVVLDAAFIGHEELAAPARGLSRVGLGFDGEQATIVAGGTF